MIGKTISHYEITEKLGEGGMGIVYKAEDLVLKRTVALKFLPPELTRNSELRQRLTREAQAASALDHASICTIYEIDEFEGQTFIVMTYVEGQSLDERVQTGPLNPGNALSIATQVAEGLQEAHEKGIVHRDIKSANIMLTGKGRAKIMDFGLAKLAGRTRITRTATIMGTVDYMSPEQALGETTDHRTDIWSLGVVLYEMLTGQLPFPAQNDAAVIHKIIYDDPEQMAYYRSDIPASLGHIVQKMMQKDPRERYADVKSMLADVHSIRQKATPATVILEEEEFLSIGESELFPLPPLFACIERSTFVGREREMTQLRSRWSKARDGQRQVVLLTGDPGIGKTRLAAELAFGANTEGSVVLFGGAEEGAGLPYQPFVEALRHYVSVCPLNMLRSQIGSTGAEMVTLAPELAVRLSNLPTSRPADPDSGRYRLFDAVTSFLVEISRANPVVMVLDDLHWADKRTFQLLRHIVRSTMRAPLFILGTYRQADLERTHPLSEALADLRRDSAFKRIALEGLNEGDVGALIGSWVSRESPAALDQAAHFIHTISKHTEGNPFFIEEVLRHLAETGGIYQQDGRWLTDMTTEQMGIPEGVKDVIGQRLSRLSDDCNSVLTIASVIGREFDLDTLERASDLSKDRLMDLQEEAITARVVAEIPHVLGRYRFSHALIHETLYDDLTTTRRVRLHGLALRYADNDGVKLAYEVLGGSGPYFVAVGLSSCAAVRSRHMAIATRWDPICKYCRVILYDRRGVGYSAAPERGYSLLASVEDLQSVLDAAGVGRVVLWGATDGGPLAIAFAVKYPERTAGLILAGTSPKLVNSEDFAFGINPAAMASFRRTDDSDLGRAVSELTHRTRPDSMSGRVEAMGEVIGRAPRHASSKIILAIGAADVRAFLSQVQAPTLILHDPGNNYIPVEAAHYLHEHIPGSKLEITKEYGAGTFGESVYQTIGAFVEEVTGRSSLQA